MSDVYDSDTKDKHDLPQLVVDIARILLSNRFPVEQVSDQAWGTYDALTAEHQKRIDKRESEVQFLHDWQEALGENEYRADKIKEQTRRASEPKEPYTKEVHEFAKAWKAGLDVVYTLRNGYCARTGISESKAYDVIHALAVSKGLIHDGPQPMFPAQKAHARG